MDYTNQIENLFKFFSLSLSSDNISFMLKLKRKFNNDLNLFGCFIKDFLIVENDGKIPDDENLYNDFVVYFENNLIHLDEILSKLDEYSNYYISLVFETVKNPEFLGYIRTINACCAMDAYPCMIKIFDDFYNQKTDSKKADKMLKFLTDEVIKRMEDTKQTNKSLFETLKNERMAS